MSHASRRPPSIDRRLLAHEPAARGWLWLAVAAGVAAAAAVVASAYLLAMVVDEVFRDGHALAAVEPMLVALVGLAVVRAGLVWVGDVAAQHGSNRVKARLRGDLTGRLVALGPAYVGRERSGELIGLLVGGIDAIDAYLATYWPARMLAGLVPALVLVVILLIDPPTTLVLLLTGPLLVLLLAVIGSRVGAITQRRFLELRWMSGFFLDILTGLATLKAFGRSREQVDNLREISQAYGQTTLEVLRTAFQTSLVLEWGGAVAVAVVAVEISLRLMTGGIAFGPALAVLIITPEFFLPLRQLAIRYHAGGAGRAAAERAFEVLDEPSGAGGSRAVSRVSSAAVAPNTLVESTETEPRTAAPSFEIRFDRVGFTYPDRETPALADLSLLLADRRITALIGPTGAGKTTVAALLLRFIEPDAGMITVGGRALNEIELTAWRASVAWVAQRPHLFEGTVADNIGLARPGATGAEIAAAADAAGATDFIAALPGGFDTSLGENGQRLSGGQRQRIAIARAFLRDAPVVILDEPTAHLDPETEELVRDAIERLARGRTVLLITHREQVSVIANSIVELGR